MHVQRRADRAAGGAHGAEALTAPLPRIDEPRGTAPLDARVSNSRVGGATFGLGNRVVRVAWTVAWLLLARWTPPQLRAWRRTLARAFGARIADGANIYASARIWLPENLVMGRGATLGPRVRCYNQATIAIDDFAIVSQDASLCTGTHDMNDPHFQLVARPIRIGRNAWIAAEAFVGPGVTIGDGAVLGARGVAMRDLEADGVYSGNPAERIRSRLCSATVEAIAP